MAEKKKDTNQPRFEVKKRQTKEKPNFFQNIRPLQHPLAEILNFPKDQPLIDLEAQDQNEDTPRKDYSGHPEDKKLDTQKSALLDTQNQNVLDTQNSKNIDTQNITNLDTQDFTPKDTQKDLTDTPRTEKSGHPESKILSTQTPRTKNDAPRKGKTDGAQAPRTNSVVHSKNAEWRKYDKTRSTVRVNLHIDKEIDRKVRQYCMIDADPKVELREFYERAAVHLLNFLGTQNLGSLGAETPLDDRRLKMLFKSKPFIINLYLRYNAIFNELSTAGGRKWAARWSPRDDEAAARYNDLPPAIVELGILQTQIQKGFGSSRIQTFKYYTDEIEKVIESGVSDEMLNNILTYHRNIWKNQTNREIDLGFLESGK